MTDNIYVDGAIIGLTCAFATFCLVVSLLALFTPVGTMTITTGGKTSVVTPMDNAVAFAVGAIAFYGMAAYTYRDSDAT